MAAPMYTQLLHTPPTVAALPVAENLPGRQEMSRKFTPCIAAQISAVRSRDATAKKPPSSSTNIISGTAHTSAMAKRMAEPTISLPYIAAGS